MAGYASSSSSSSSNRIFVEVDVIVPVHNAAATLRETLQSALVQVWPRSSSLASCGGCGCPTAAAAPGSQKLPEDCTSSTTSRKIVAVEIYVCCYNDASTDESWSILQELQKQHHNNDEIDAASASQRTTTTTSSSCCCNYKNKEEFFPLPTHLCIATSPEGRPSRGAGYARNRAVDLRPALRVEELHPNNKSSSDEDDDDDDQQQQQQQEQHQFLCWLDSDDLMHPQRVYHQVSALLALPSPQVRHCTLLGCCFDRIPADATWHYTHWANHRLADPERLWLERFREVTLLQPTWMMCRSRFDQLGGYLEAPPPPPLSGDDSSSTSTSSSSSSSSSSSLEDWIRQQQQKHWRLVHTTFETPFTLRLAEDLRLFHEHILAGIGRLQRCETPQPLVTYRAAHGSSQSSQTPRSLLLQLRAMAWEVSVLWKSEPQLHPGTCITNNNQKNHPTTTNNQEDDDDDTAAPSWKRFVIWGAGRDGKDLIKALSPAARRRVYCMVDVDDKKIAHGVYEYHPSRCCRRRPTPKDSNSNNNNNKTDNETFPMRIPIVHFSLLARDETVRNALYRAWKEGKEEHGGGTEAANCTTVEENNGTAPPSSSSSFLAPAYGRIDKTNKSAVTATTTTTTNASATIIENKPPFLSSSQKRRKTNNSDGGKKDPGVAMLDLSLIPTLPVVVCVAMYRTGGALERNVSMIGRTEGKDLWHFS